MNQYLVLFVFAHLSRALACALVLIFIGRVLLLRPKSFEYAWAVGPLLAWIGAKMIVHLLQVVHLQFNIGLILIAAEVVNAIAALIGSVCVVIAARDIMAKPSTKELRAVNESVVQTLVQVDKKAKQLETKIAELETERDVTAEEVKQERAARDG